MWGTVIRIPWRRRDCPRRIVVKEYSDDSCRQNIGLTKESEKEAWTEGFTTEREEYGNAYEDEEMKERGNKNEPQPLFRSFPTQRCP